MSALSIGHRLRRTLHESYSPGQNAFGFLRLVLAIGVLVAHAWPLGFGLPSPGWSVSSGQVDLGMLCVQGFFVVSGFLVTGSGLRFPLPRYLWHRALRIFPGLWVCLLVTAFVLAPLAAYHELGGLDGFWTHPAGPTEYVRTNWLASMEQYPISGLLADTPFGRLAGAPSAFNGSLWSLRYELGCYALLGALLGTAALRRAPRTVLLLLVLCYAFIVRDVLTAGHWTVRPPDRGAVGPFPLVGSFAANHVLYLGFLFLGGVAARLYAHRLPMSGPLALVATVTAVGTAWQGAFVVLGLPAYAYLLLYLGVALPSRLTRIGRTRDYSYGIYIYAFPVQQLVALFGGARYGLWAYLALSLLGTLVLAIASWHLVERPALALKRWSRPSSRRPRPAPRHRPRYPVAPEPVASATRSSPGRSTIPVAPPSAPTAEPVSAFLRIRSVAANGR
ncbi:acyltransferase [Micromonospora sp. WMMD1102]|uniref:acyltransferase family protein n=1 Tax=Micromonospora sp. WMMD1102 TaxID=3016105 RepID=UPI0024156F8B|nr:acyltransferase [Micromonospora sp. WMMD1102]MDG4786356.1 acyltransferase [Micromonospora sp. WMMD1102]